MHFGRYEGKLFINRSIVRFVITSSVILNDMCVVFTLEPALQQH